MKYIMVILVLFALVAYSWICPPKPDDWNSIKVGASVYDSYFTSMWSECYDGGMVKYGTNSKWSDFATWRINKNIVAVEFEFDKSWNVIHVEVKNYRRSGIFWVYENIVNLVL